MSIAGLAITLSTHRDDAVAAVASLREHPDIEVGDRAGPRIAVTADTPSRDADRRLYEWIGSLAGVLRVDVVFVAFEDDQTQREHMEDAES